MSSGSCSTQPEAGKCCGNSCCARAAIEMSLRNTIAREEVVPWSMARTKDMEAYPDVFLGVVFGVFLALSREGIIVSRQKERIGDGRSRRSRRLAAGASDPVGQGLGRTEAKMLHAGPGNRGGMTFTSFQFGIFVAVVFGAYYLPPLRRFQVQLLVLASLVFYGSGQPELLPLLLLAVLGTYLCLVLAFDNRAVWMPAGIVFNLALLAFFKYKLLFIDAGSGSPDRRCADRFAAAAAAADRHLVLRVPQHQPAGRPDAREAAAAACETCSSTSSSSRSSCPGRSPARPSSCRRSRPSGSPRSTSSRPRNGS